ncbi:hypothetical protein [Streptosporangium saharense]|uniref:hypothetical protein n=1 Tax=Streptosporangium saharense TaxID=1706840 RepID=UPI003317AAD0
MRDLLVCQCRRTRDACTRTATQEDIRCDVCRGGCAQIGFGAPGTPPDQITVSGHWEPPFTAWGEIEEHP